MLSGGGGWVPTHYKVKLQLILRLSWAVTILLCYNDIIQYINDYLFFVNIFLLVPSSEKSLRSSGLKVHVLRLPT